MKYDPQTGVITRDGKPVGTRNTAGYTVMRFNGKVVYAHRLAWFLTHGVWPGTLDHINGDRSDNRLANLREVSSRENAQNQRVRATRSGRLPGAHFHKPSGRFKSAIRVDGQQQHLGYFNTEEEASAAYLAAKRQQHPAWSGHA